MTNLDIHGLPPEENCLHCFLWPIINKWRDEHSHLTTEQIEQGLLQVASEIIGSAIVNSNADMDRATKRAANFLEKTIRDNVYEYRRLGLGKSQS